jgi:ABC-type glycerol-3-phosphate transport system substrate-binding protein
LGHDVVAEKFSAALETLSKANNNTAVASYTQIPAQDLERRLIEALASGTGPDAVLLPQELIVRFRDKILPISYKSITLRQFKDTYVDEAELFTSDQGILGIPFTVDPLVLYWNRDLYSTAGIAQPPKNWTEVQDVLPKLSKRNTTTGVVSQSAFALGEYSNVNNAKAIVSALMLQGGSPIVAKDDRGITISTLAGSDSARTAAASDAVRFYTQFANPVHKNYVWNRAMPNSLQAFVSGDLANYIGFSSELPAITTLNPNLNFDIAAFPQAPNARLAATFGNMTGMVVMRGTQNPANTLAALMIIGGKDFVSLWSNYSNVAPARRDLMVSHPDDPYLDVVYSAALISRAWLDPNPRSTENIFRNLIERITSGQLTVPQALNTAHRELTSVLLNPVQ